MNVSRLRNRFKNERLNYKLTASWWENVSAEACTHTEGRTIRNHTASGFICRISGGMTKMANSDDRQGHLVV